MKKFLIVVLVPVALVILSLLFVRNYQECLVYNNMLPNCDGPIVEERGFIPFVQNGEISWTMVAVNYMLWLLVITVIVVLVPKIYKIIKIKPHHK